MKHRTTVFVADDHPIMLKGLTTLLETQAEFLIVGSATNGLETVRRVREQTPNLLILDLMMPDLNGLDVLGQVRKISPETRVLILSMHNDRSYVLEAFRRGASGYVVKDAATAQVVDAARQVLSGQRYLNALVSQQEIDSYLKNIQEPELDSDET